MELIAVSIIHFKLLELFNIAETALTAGAVHGPAGLTPPRHSLSQTERTNFTFKAKLLFFFFISN